jgi:phage terminase Nu1 subunit (DNA packaging protein)
LNGVVSADMLARLLKLTPRRVRQLADEGVLPRHARGAYAFAPCVQAYLRYLLGGSNRDPEVDTIKLARTRLMTAQADLSELELEEELNDLVRVSAVREHWQAISLRMATKIEAIEAKLVASWERISGETAPAHVKLEIVKLINEATAEIDQPGVPPSHNAPDDVSEITSDGL